MGIDYDRSNLNWTENIESFKTKLLKSIVNLYKTRYYLNVNALYYVFNSLLMSHIRYGLPYWGRVNKNKINNIKLMNKAIRCIYFKNWKENVSRINYKENILCWKYDQIWLKNFYTQIHNKQHSNLLECRLKLLLWYYEVWNWDCFQKNSW